MKSKEIKGITLIALVITIIVLLILAGVTINLVLGQSGLLKKAQYSENMQTQEAAKEKLSLAILDLQVKKQAKIELSNLIEITDNDIEVETIDKQVTIYEEDNQKYALCTINGYKFKVYNSLKIVPLEDESVKTEEEMNVLIGYSSTTTNLKNDYRPIKLIDNSENNHDATLNNLYYNNGKGIIFDGSSTYGTLDSKSLNLTFPLTITATVNWKTASNNILFTDETSKIAIGAYNQKFLLSNAPFISSYYNMPTDFLINDVNYMTIIYKTSATDLELYINGKQIDPTSSTGHWNLNEAGTYLGRRNSGSYFNGILYDFKIYNKDFSSEEIETLYNMEQYNFENNVISNNKYSENVVLHFDCSRGKNQEEEYPNVIKSNLGENSDIQLYNIKYNNLKNGLVFDGTQSYGIIRDTTFKLDFPLTLTFIINSDDLSNNIIFTNQLSKIGIGFYESKYMILENDTSTAAYYNISNEYLKNDINYITVVYENSSNTNKLYINGKEIASEKIYNGWRLNEKGTYLGKRDSGSYFNGTLYKFKIYNQILTQEEIIKEYQNDKEYYSTHTTNQ